MKINKLFHWLYFSVMALPLLVAPIFAVYSHRHTLTEHTQVDIQYKYQSNEVRSYTDLVTGNVYSFANLSTGDMGGFYLDFTFELLRGEMLFGDIDGIDFFDNYAISYNTPYHIYFDDNFNLDFIPYDDLNTVSMSLTGSYFECDGCIIRLLKYNDFDSNIIGDIQDYFSYTDYNEIENVDVQDTSSDIMSVFLGNYANAIDKYFNYDNVVNFGTLYSWLNSTFFSGQAPLGFFIFWHLLEYWLLTSLLWLLFDVLIYVPMLLHRWLDKASIS